MFQCREYSKDCVWVYNTRGITSSVCFSQTCVCWCSSSSVGCVHPEERSPPSDPWWSSSYSDLRYPPDSYLSPWCLWPVLLSSGPPRSVGSGHWWSDVQMNSDVWCCCDSPHILQMVPDEADRFCFLSLNHSVCWASVRRCLFQNCIRRELLS